MNWENKEIGPTCFCGMPTCIILNDNEGSEEASLLCAMHPGLMAALFPLPKNKPDNWPNLSDEEIDILIEKGFKEREWE